MEGFVDLSAILHCGVYALLRRGVVVYIGQTQKPWIRLYSHASARGKLRGKPMGHRQVKLGIAFDQVWIRPCMLGELNDLELEMIRKYQPIHNVKGLPKPDIDLAELLAKMTPVMPAVAEPRIDRRF